MRYLLGGVVLIFMFCEDKTADNPSPEDIVEDTLFIDTVRTDTLTQETLISDSDTLPLSYLALGDSYTIGESVPTSERWPMQLAHRLREEAGYDISEPKIIAQTGWTTGSLQSAINSAELDVPYDLVSLLIGVNNQFQGLSQEAYEDDFESQISQSIQFAGGNKDRVFVLSIPDYGVTPFGASRKEQIAKEIDEFNTINRNITESYGIKYFDITGISRAADSIPELIANDNLHPSGEMYRQWVEKIYPWTVEILDE